MTRHTLAGIAAALALCGCGRSHATPQETSARSPAETADTPMTVTGCLVPSGETPESRAVGTSGNPPPPHFTLADATVAAPGATAHSFSLVADEDRLADLQRFANSRVEVTGFVVASTGTGAPDAGAARGPVGAPPDDVRRVRVTDVRQLESTCGERKKE